MAYLMIGKREKQDYRVAGNHKYKETDSRNSKQSSMKSYTFWVTLYILFLEMWISRKKSKS